MTITRQAQKPNRHARLLGLVTLATLASLALSACGSGGGHRRDDNGNIVPTARELDPAGTLYSDTLDAANAGECSQETISVLTCYAYRGHGYEGAQTALGQCLIEAKQPQDGLLWLNRAADAGWPDAQKALAHIYLDGKTTDVDLVAAGKWAVLYSKNPSLLSLGVLPEKKLSEEIRERLSQTDRSEAMRQANAWNAKFWTPKTALDSRTAATCYVAPRRAIPDNKFISSPDPFDQ